MEFLAVGEWLSRNAIPLGAFVISVLSYRRAGRAGRRAPPIFEPKVGSDAPWQGWSMVSLWISHDAPSTLEITRLSTRRFDRALIGLFHRLPTEGRARNFKNPITGKESTRVNQHLVTNPPQNFCGSDIKEIDIAIAANRERKTRIDVVIEGKLPRKLRIHYHWRDGQKAEPKLLRIR